MHYLKTPLSDEIYNQLLSISNSTEFVASLFEERNEEQQTTNNTISIRMLSEKEYQNYIKTNTLDGSITKNNDDVWHYYYNPYYIILMYASGHKNDAANRFASYSGVLKTKNCNYVTCGNGANYYLPNYRELYSNNKTNIAYNSENEFTDVQVLYYNPFESGLRNLGTSISNNSSKNTFPYKYFSASGSGGFQVSCNIYRYTAFRPVFQYVDNRKSTNIYS